MIHQSKNLKWLENVQTDPTVRHLICTYINHHGEAQSFLPNRSTYSKYKATTLIHDVLLEWSNFMDLRREDIWIRKLKRNEDIWARGLMRRLLQMTHQQWSYRNATVNLKIEGCTRFEHNCLLEEIDQCLESDPGVLLQDHRQL